MTQDELASLSFAELRDRVTARADDPKSTDDLDPFEVLRYFIALPVSSHTSDSAHTLLHLTRIFGPAGQPAEMLQSALLMSRIAIAINDRVLLSRARNKQGIALVKVGRLTEATLAQAEAWSLAHELEDKNRELDAVWGFSTISVAMGQWNAAIRYCERMRAIAEELGLARYEFTARNNLADCALQLRDSALALRTLSKLASDAPHAELLPDTYAHLHNNLARSWLLIGDVAAANLHVKEAADWAAIWSTPNVVSSVEALQGLVDVRLENVDSGLLAVNRALSFAKQANVAEVPNCLGICIDAYEAAGRLDEALAYLQELVEWKKRSVDAEIMRSRFQGVTESVEESVEPQTGNSLFDDGLLAKVHSLHAGVQSRLERLLEIAVNAGISSGHDLYRPFRLANLARYLATSLGWDQQRIASLVWGAQLCNIGMIAIPARILVKPDRLSEGESHVLRGHTEYGAELLRKSKLQILDVAAVIAEQHHERYDGSGYPRGLSGGAIAEEARIVAVCDAFDAMTHKRPSRHTPLSVDAAMKELLQGAGSQFDPPLVNVFAEFIQREFSQHDDFEVFLAEGADEVEYVRVRARMEALIADGR
jgi:HD-GYP domain-containing protein (c-di-GMP phosphodiesterase class II)